MYAFLWRFYNKNDFSDVIFFEFEESLLIGHYFWITMTLVYFTLLFSGPYFEPDFFRVTNRPMFSNKNNGCRLTGRLCNIRMLLLKDFLPIAQSASLCCVDVLHTYVSSNKLCDCSIHSCSICILKYTVNDYSPL